MANNKKRFLVEYDLNLYDAIKALADQRHINVSCLIRQTMVKELNASKVAIAAPPAPPPAPPKPITFMPAPNPLPGRDVPFMNQSYKQVPGGLVVTYQRERTFEEFEEFHAFSELYVHRGMVCDKYGWWVCAVDSLDAVE